MLIMLQSPISMDVNYVAKSNK